MIKIAFWIALIIETAALCWFVYKIWLLYSGKSGYLEAYPELYRQNLIPAVILTLIIAGALVARFGFNAPRVATWIAFSPALIFVFALIGMAIASMFIRDWR